MLCVKPGCTNVKSLARATWAANGEIAAATAIAPSARQPARRAFGVSTNVISCPFVSCAVALPRLGAFTRMELRLRSGGRGGHMRAAARVKFLLRRVEARLTP